MTYSLNASSLVAVTAGTKSDGDTTSVGTSNFYTIVWSSSMAIDSSSKTFSDEYSGTQRIKLNGKWTGSKQYIKFTTTKASTVKVWWVAGGDNRTVDIAPLSSSAPTSVTASDGVSSTKNSAYISTFTLADGGDWMLGSAVGGNYIFKIEVTE